MSEAFDPEQVERVWVTTDGDIISTRDALFPPAQTFTSAADYDKLLALYREAVKPPMQSISLANEKKLNDWGFTYDGPKHP